MEVMPLWIVFEHYLGGKGWFFWILDRPPQEKNLEDSSVIDNNGDIHNADHEHLSQIVN